SVVDLAVGLGRSTRPLEGAPDFIKKWVAWGAGPRASQALVLGAKARALLEGRLAVDASDVLRIARPILRHRVVLNFQAEAEGVRVDEVIGKLISS
ncbi:MAG: AAA family ATPase, partial [Elusimicrobiota bacterium]